PNRPSRAERRRAQKNMAQRRWRRTRRIASAVFTRLANTVTNLRNHLRRPMAIILALCSFVSAVGGYFVYWPKTGATISAPLRDSDPFSVPVVISNDGRIPLTQLVFTCRLMDMDSGVSVPGFSGPMYKFYEVETTEPVRYLAPGRTTTTPCHRALETVD